MPILETERQSMPRSALRYRPIHTDQAGPAPVVSRRPRPDASMNSAKVAPDDLEEELELPVAPRRRTIQSARHHRRFYPIFWLGIGALILVLLWWAISQMLVWGNNELNTLRYGYPRTFQIDAVVGQNDDAQHPSHFLALNLRGTITIIDFPGGDPTKARDFVITSALGPSSDLDPVTLRFIDANHNGYLDMIIDIDGVESVMVNDGTTFRSPSPTEQQQILNVLRQSGQ